MKIITARQLDSVVSTIIDNEEKKAKLRHETFNGISQEAVLSELNVRLGDGWVLKKDPPVQFTKEDINAVAGSRFFRQSGMTLAMGWIIIIGLLNIFTSSVPIIPQPVYFALNFGVTIIFFYVYIKKLRQVRKVLWENIDGVK